MAPTATITPLRNTKATVDRLSTIGVDLAGDDGDAELQDGHVMKFFRGCRLSQVFDKPDGLRVRETSGPPQASLPAPLPQRRICSINLIPRYPRGRGRFEALER